MGAMRVLIAILLLFPFSGFCVSYTNGIISYVTTTGDDSTFVRGDIAHPALTVGHAVSNMLAGDTVFIAPGLYTVTNQLVLPRNSVLTGSGMSYTTISNYVGNDCLMVVADNNQVKDFCIYGPFPDEPFHPPIGARSPATAITNVLIQRVSFTNDIDCFFFESQYAVDVTVDSCYMDTTWDFLVCRRNLENAEPLPRMQIYNSLVNVINSSVTNFAGGSIPSKGLDIKGNGTFVSFCNTRFYYAPYSQPMLVLKDGATLRLDSCQFTYPDVIANNTKLILETYFASATASNNIVEFYACDVPNTYINVASASYGRGAVRYNYSLCSPPGKVKGLMVVKGKITLK